MHAGKRSAPNEHALVLENLLCAHPCQHRAVVVQLTADRQQLSRVARGATPMPIVKHRRRETGFGEPLGEWAQSRGLHSADAVGHHHDWVRTRCIGQVHPRVNLLAMGRGYADICPSTELRGHALTPPGVTISPPACLAKSAPNNAPGVNAPGGVAPSANCPADSAATRAVNA